MSVGQQSLPHALLRTCKRKRECANLRLAYISHGILRQGILLNQNPFSAKLWRLTHIDGGKVRLGADDLFLPEIPLLVAASSKLTSRRFL